MRHELVLTEDLCKMTLLQTLILSLEQLSGPVPKCLGNLALLEVLAFHNSHPSGRRVAFNLEGKLPSSIWQLRKLKELTIRETTLVGFETPPEAGSFPELLSIDLSWSTQLEGDLTALLQTSPKLTNIDFSTSLISFSSGSLRHLTSLLYFRFSDLSFKWTIEEDFWRTHPALRVLELQNARLVTGSISHEIGLMRNLSTLLLESTALSGTIPPSIVNCPLNVLSIARTQISPQLPSNIGDLNETLTRLDLSYIRGPTATLPESIGALNRLQYLYTTSSGFYGTFPSGLENALDLVSLKLNNNNFTGTLPSVAAVKDGFNADFQTNHFTGTIPPSIAIHADELRLAYNDFDYEIPPYLFNYSAKFVPRLLDLSNNRFSGCLPRFPSNAPEIVKLAYNNFSCDVPTEYKLIKDLTLSYNKLNGNLTSFFLEDQLHSRLIGLRLDNNHLYGTIPTLSDTIWPTLQDLSLSNNQLSGILPQLPATLRTLDLSGNKFTMWQDVEAAIKDLTLLDLSRNFMTLSNTSYFDLIGPKMIYISLAHNNLGNTDQSSNKHFPTVVALDLTNCSLRGSFTIWQFPRISLLKIAQNRISGGLTLVPLRDTLVQLDISNNEIFMDAAEISSMPFLTSIIASQNRIYGSLKLTYLPSIQTVNLGSNNLSLPLDLASLGLLYSTQLQFVNVSNNLQLPRFNKLDSSTDLKRTSSSSPSIAFPKSVTCYELSFFEGKSFIYDEDLFNYGQCDCNQDYFGLPPTNCRKCPTDGTLSCGATQVTISNTSYGFTYIPSSSSTPSTLPQSPHSQQVSISSIFASLTSTFGLGYYDDVISNINAIGTTHEIETESCLVTTIQTLSSSSNCRGVQITSSDLVGTHVSLESLLKPQCAEGSDGRLCSRCICDVAKEGSSPSCWFSSGPTCSKCRRVFPLSTSLPLVLSMMVLLIVVMSIVIGIVLHRKRRQSLKSFSNLALPKRIFYRVMHLTTLGNVSIVVTFLQMLIGITQWDVYARVSILGVLNGGGEGYDSTFSIFSLL